MKKAFSCLFICTFIISHFCQTINASDSVLTRFIEPLSHLQAKGVCIQMPYSHNTMGQKLGVKNHELTITPIHDPKKYLEALRTHEESKNQTLTLDVIDKKRGSTTLKNFQFNHSSLSELSTFSDDLNKIYNINLRFERIILTPDNEDYIILSAPRIIFNNCFVQTNSPKTVVRIIPPESINSPFESFEIIPKRSIITINGEIDLRPSSLTFKNFMASHADYFLKFKNNG